MKNISFFALLIGLCLQTSCLFPTVFKSNKSKEPPKEVDLKIDISKITYSRLRESIPVKVRTKNPELTYGLRYQTSPSSSGVFMFQIGEAMNMSSPLIWNRFMDVRTDQSEPIAAIEMDMRDISGEVITHFSTHTDYANTRVARSIRFTLVCSLIGAEGKRIIELSATRGYSKRLKFGDVDKSLTQVFQTLYIEAFDELLRKFFSNDRVATELSISPKAVADVTSGEKKKKNNGKSIVVVLFDVDDASRKFNRRLLEQLTIYLRTALVQTEIFRLVPRDQIRSRLLKEKKNSYRKCVDESCQIELGKALAAQKTLVTRLLRVGKKCVVTANLFDLQSETAEKGAKVTTGCSEEMLLDAMQKIADQLSSQYR